MSKQPSVYLIRHGLRADHSLSGKGGRDQVWASTAAYPFDPPITTEAVDIAKRVANELNRLILEENNNPRIVIYTSPFLRCVQTALVISAGLHTTSKPHLRLDPTLSEWLSPQHFEPYPPSPHHGWVDQMLNRRIDEIASNFIHPADYANFDSGWSQYIDIDWNFKGWIQRQLNNNPNMIIEETFLPYPEHHSNLRERSRQAFHLALEDAIQGEPNNSWDVIIFIGHGHTVTTLLETAISNEISTNTLTARMLTTPSLSSSLTSQDSSSSSSSSPPTTEPSIVLPTLYNLEDIEFNHEIFLEKSSDTSIRLMDLEVPPCSITRLVPSDPSAGILVALNDSISSTWMWQCDMRAKTF